ncbi:Regulatory protein MgsR [Vibrio aerogenes CECT 7868]|uniref:Regulatory protein MgsR n=1 Tax=Vibrio aerogenes CECT 7868 TaxID=1216006 RepID=A0A1M5W889_9VIBR|nr:ArsC family reductase [Vibrio aerogenes]SHH83706.1 Regulatory protein MgsR [Vibrio aerogenes CECT 7868]
MSIILYGIPNCDTIKKARKWLAAENIDYQFHDYRKDGISASLVESFCSELEWNNVLNKRGTTYRQLEQTQKDNLTEETAVDLLVQYPAMIKRPILSVDNHLYLGFSPEKYSTIFSTQSL